MKTKKLLNAAAVIMVIMLILSAVMLLGNDWFRSVSEPGIVTSSMTGLASIMRRGSGYRLKENIALAEGDGIMTSAGASASFAVKDCGIVTMDENSEILVEKDTSDSCCIVSVYGTVVCSAVSSGRPLTISCPAGILSADEGSLYSVETFHGTQTVKVYRGKATVHCDDSGEDIVVLPGKQLVVMQNDDGANTYEQPSEIPVQSMSGFLIDMLLGDGDPCFFPKDVLEAEMERRRAEVEQARAEREAYEAAVIAQGGTVPIIESTKPLDEYMTADDLHICTVTIVCGTVLDNMDSLSAGKNAYIPENGVILATSAVQFVEGESAYDVLKRACAAADIPLEYSWTVEYGGYYIEGINNLYEFDCGPESGWMYKVNGWFPNYSSSNYILKEGDIIVWAYTCEGLGNDLGLDWKP